MKLLKILIIWWCDLDPRFKNLITGVLIFWTLIISFFSKQLIEFIL